MNDSFLSVDYKILSGSANVAGASFTYIIAIDELARVALRGIRAHLPTSLKGQGNALLCDCSQNWRTTSTLASETFAAKEIS
jgi:hypothetical protein